ncbi:helix-turn-helix domain-containing protein [Novosphingobium sp.]|jgi:AraC family transcriptional activator of pyochelin receptor|uniref:helix-turn-helix domain-containing protein n=1 Tax=Novosphingobium sp. TaxID=1874826 RepID=UPI002FE0ECF9
MNNESPMTAIEVSPEMISLIGEGPLPSFDPPPAPMAFVMTFGSAGVPATLRYLAAPDRTSLDEVLGADREERVILLVSAEACRRILGDAPLPGDGTIHHLSAALLTIALAIRDCDLPEMARTPYRLAKSIELLCEILRVQGQGGLVSLSQDRVLSSTDRRRLLAARRIIDERWSEKLTLDMIARGAGLNRAKLTRGFRELFDCSVADAIAEQRLSEAGQMLLSTDLPVSSIGYRCGYLNNASFARAFARKFGQAPTHYRAHYRTGRLAA